VARLRRERIAHRDLRLANVLLDADGDAWLIDFGFAELAAGDDMLDEDAAELLCSTYAEVGAGRAVAAAVGALGPGPVTEALRYVQPAALSGATRRAVNALPGKVKPLQEEILRVTGSPEPRYAQVERVSARRVAVWLFTGVAVYLLIHQLSDVQLLAQQIKDVDWRWLPAIVAMAVLSYRPRWAAWPSAPASWNARASTPPSPSPGPASTRSPAPSCTPPCSASSWSWSGPAAWRASTSLRPGPWPGSGSASWPPPAWSRPSRPGAGWSTATSSPACGGPSAACGSWPSIPAG
jgi:hypothetical protein